MKKKCNGNEVKHLLNVPEKSAGSCGIMAMLDRSCFSGIFDVSTSSIRISPSMQANRKMAPINELLPEIEKVRSNPLISAISIRFNELT